MQCPSCHFQNIPGTQECGRCGSPLGLKGLAVDVHPPRAGPWTKRLRRWLPVRSVYYRVLDLRQPDRPDPSHRPGQLIEMPGTELDVWLRLIVPGWAQLHLGQKLSGRIFLGSYLVLLLAAIATYGTMFGAMLLGWAFSLHVASCLSVLRMGGVRGGAYWRNVVVVFFVLLLVIYVPTGWLVSRLAYPVVNNMQNGDFAEGDVALCSLAQYWFRPPRAGDIVLYERRTESYQTGNHAYLRIPAGDRIDRLLAGPGDHVVCQNTELIVNGEPCRWQPGLGQMGNVQLELIVPAGHYFVWPGVIQLPPQFRPETFPTSVWFGVTMIPAASIQGRIYMRWLPFNRMQRIS